MRADGDEAGAEQVIARAQRALDRLGLSEGLTIGGAG
jgi:hypothetical protein